MTSNKAPDMLWSDEDALSDPTTHYIISGFIRECQSLLPSKTYYNIISPIIDICKIYYFLDIKTETNEYRQKITLIYDFWEKIDLDDCGDLDIEEFVQGLQLLKVALSEDEMKQLFKFLDDDDSGFVDRQQFIMFLMTSFQSRKLNNFRQSILKVLHPNYSENVMNITATPDWAGFDDYMCFGPPQLGVTKTTAEALFKNLEEQCSNPYFGMDQNCKNWNKYEVAAWLQKIGFSECMEPFMMEDIRGDMLLYDLDANILWNEFGFCIFDATKMLRERDKLKQKIEMELVEECGVNETMYASQIFSQTECITKLENIISSKDDEIERLNMEIQRFKDKQIKYEMLSMKVKNINESKIDLAISTAQEIERLRLIIKMSCAHQM
eukprot:354875_1